MLLSHLSPAKRKQAVSSMMMPQATLLAQTGMSRPVISSTMEEKDAPQTLACMPNQPMQLMARMELIMYFAPFSPSADEAATAVGRPVSQPSMPMKIMSTQMSA